MRNTGWYIPYWRKIKKKGKAEKASTQEVVRGDEQLEAVRRRWIERYRRTLRALTVMGLSMGSSRSDVQARYEQLRGAGAPSERELEDAYRYLLRVLPPVERRRKRSSASASEGTDMAHRTVGMVVVEETVLDVDVDVEIVTAIVGDPDDVDAGDGPEDDGDGNEDGVVDEVDENDARGDGAREAADTDTITYVHLSIIGQDDVGEVG